MVSLGSSKFSAQVLALHTVLDLLEEIWWLEKTRYLHGFPAYIYAALPRTVECLMSLFMQWGWIDHMEREPCFLAARTTSVKNVCLTVTFDLNLF